ncbi:MAG TPA: DUF6538 domain-containing protein [Candidatus Babeliaceae bacterium]|nr:DUF6538 domain-containing protein [Candidatus Babeliaceae bacterium]
MQYIIEREGHYYFNRRVPKEYQEYDRRKSIRFSLKTDSRRGAAKEAALKNAHLEAYWQSLVIGKGDDALARHKAAAERARLLNFSYIDVATLAGMDSVALFERAKHVETNNYDLNHVEAVLGGIAMPEVTLKDVLPKYWEIAKPNILNKSPHQVQKWRAGRITAMNNFIGCVGNKPVSKLTRQDVTRFRDWWIERIKTGKYVSASANKDFKFVKNIIGTVAEEFKIKLEEGLFKNLLIKLDDARRRLPFATDYLRDVLLRPENLRGLNDEARHIIYAFAETGAGLSELTGLEKEDIILDAPIPYIHIRRKQYRCLKTKFRERKIPLVGYALDAFKAYPEGFTAYKDDLGNLTTLISHYLNHHDLLPSKNHSLYSLRHSFQDRLLAENAPDRVQADLMGHKFSREAYGDGATLEQKLDYMQKIQLKS